MSNYLQYKSWKSEAFGDITFRNRIYFKSILTQLNVDLSQETVVEIGFGNGEFLAFCKEQKAKTIYGVELEAELVDRGKNANFNVIHHEDIENLLLKLEPLDNVLVFMLDVIEHMEYEQAVNFLKRLSIANSKITLILRTPNMDGISGNVAFYGDSTHKCGFGKIKFQQLASDTGFELEKIFGDLKIKRKLGFMGVIDYIRRKVLLGISLIITRSLMPNFEYDLLSPNLILKMYCFKKL